MRSFTGEHFRACGFCVLTVGRYEATIRKYIKEPQVDQLLLNQIV